MSKFQISQTFLLASRALVRIVPLQGACRYFATRDSAGYITLPQLDAGQSYLELLAVRNASLQFDDQDREFRLVGGGGWADSRTVASKLSASFETFFNIGVAIPAGQVCPTFLADYSLEFDEIQQTRDNKDKEVYIEMLKEMGQDPNTGTWRYDFVGCNGVFRQYREGGDPNDMFAVSFNFVSRSKPSVGRYDHGSTPLPIGEIPLSILFTELAAGNRQYVVAPANNAGSVALASNITVTYTSDGTTPLAQLALGQPDGSGFRLENAQSGVRIPCTVTLLNGVVTIDPAEDLPASTILQLVVRDGALTQAVNPSGVADANGMKKALQGFRSLFTTAAS